MPAESGMTPAITIATAILDPDLRAQAQRALGQMPLSALGDISGYGGIAELVSEIGRIEPDILLLGIPGLPMDAAEAVRQIRACAGAPRVVALHHAADADTILEVMRAGAAEFLYLPFEQRFAEAITRISADCARDRQSRRAGGPVYALLSAKGGCGATTLACHTAAYIRRATQKHVLVADMDFCAGNVGPLFGATPRYSILDALDNLNRLDLTLWTALATTTKEGVDLIGSPAEPADFAGQVRALSILTRFWRSQYDFTIADFGHGITPTACHLMNVVDSLILVTTEDLPSLRMAKQAIRTLVKHNVGPNRLKLVVNRVPKHPTIQVPELERIMDFPIFAAIPNDFDLLSKAYSEQRLLDVESSVGAPLAAFAWKLAGIPHETPKRKRFALFG